jgi:hypothetical protein
MQRGRVELLIPAGGVFADLQAFRSTIRCDPALQLKNTKGKCGCPGMVCARS